MLSAFSPLSLIPLSGLLRASFFITLKTLSGRKENNQNACMMVIGSTKTQRLQGPKRPKRPEDIAKEWTREGASHVGRLLGAAHWKLRLKY